MQAENVDSASREADRWHRAFMLADSARVKKAGVDQRQTPKKWSPSKTQVSQAFQATKSCGHVTRR